MVPVSSKKTWLLLWFLPVKRKLKILQLLKFLLEVENPSEFKAVAMVFTSNNSTTIQKSFFNLFDKIG